jgi:hypothetical protein
MAILDSNVAHSLWDAKQASANEFAKNAADGSAVSFTMTGVSGKRHAIDGVLWSMGGDPAAPVVIQVKDGTNILREWEVTKGGPGFIPFYHGIKGSPGADMTLALAAPGQTISAHIEPLSHWTE